MKILSVLSSAFIAVYLMGCAGSPKVDAPSAPKSFSYVGDDRPSGMTKEGEEEIRNAANEKYIFALMETIEDIDDGTSSADVIARAAVFRNMDLLRNRLIVSGKIMGYRPVVAEAVRKALEQTPTQDDIDEASHAVLMLRKKR